MRTARLVIILSLSLCGVNLYAAEPATVSPPLSATAATTSTDTAVSSQSKSDTEDKSDPNITRFADALADIREYYVNDVSMDELFDNAIRGMLTGLDPHSSYLDPQDFNDLKTQTTGEFAGVGIEVGVDNRYIEVISPIDGTPAAKAGILPGDYIVKINGKPVMGSDLQSAVAAMRGEKGTTVKLTLYRKSDEKLKEMTIERDIIKVQSIKYGLLDRGFGYIRIAQFQDPTMRDLSDALKKLIIQNNNQPLKGLVLDLRNDPGGLLDSAVDVSDAFLDSTKLKDNRLIVYTKGRAQESQFEARATPGDLLNGAPIVVLINEGTASAAEIVAGALQDHHRAVILGTNSFGKGSVQTVMQLDNDHAIKITTALYYTPNGRSIQAAGIKPDIYVPLMQLKQPEHADMLAMATVKEADLDHHISQAQGTPQNPAIPQTLAVKEIGSDYQLQEALHILKGIVVANRANTSATQVAGS